MKPPRPDRRKSTLRRQFNEAFCTPDGEFSWSKFIAAWGQVICCYLLLHHAEAIIAHWDALSILLTFVILPELAKRIIMSKYPVAK